MQRLASVLRSARRGLAAPRLPLAAPLPQLPCCLPGHRSTGLGGTRWLRTSAPVWTASKPPSSNGPPPDPGAQPPGAQPPGAQPQGQAGSEPGEQGAGEPDPLQDASMGLVQRFQRTMKQYGKVLVPVHLVTSSLWIGAFYYTAMKGVNVVPFLEYVGFPERLVNLLEKSQSGYALTAYAMYKIATPARYTVTLGGTSLSVKYLRRHGYLSTPPPMTEYLQDKMEDARDRLSEKMGETRERLSERMGETKDKLSGRLQDTKDKVSFRKKSSE